MTPENCEQARPETHQNLIHIAKEPAPPISFGDTSGIEIFHEKIRMPITVASPRYMPPGSDPGPTNPIIRPIRGGGGGDRIRTDDPLLAKQVLSQLSYTPRPGPEVGTPNPDASR
jgi:hypothetical protein